MIITPPDKQGLQEINLLGLGPARARAHGPLPIGPGSGPGPGPWALAHWARVRPGPGPMGPCPLAHGPWPMGPCPWAMAHGPLPIGPMGPGPLGSPGDQKYRFFKLGMALPGVEMSGHLGIVFLTYLGPPSSHIFKIRFVAQKGSNK